VLCTLLPNLPIIILFIGTVIFLSKLKGTKPVLSILPDSADRSAAGTLIEVLLAVRQLILVRKLLPILLELRFMLAKLPLLLD
jgi:hypothetical protein